jgi:bacteriocin-like protein
MNKKKLLSQATLPGKRITTLQNLPTEMVELSEKELQQIAGGSFSASVSPILIGGFLIGC